MPTLLLELGTFILATGLALLVIYLESSLQSQYIILAGLILGLIVLQKYSFGAAASKAGRQSFFRKLLLFFSSLLVELLVYITGGIFSLFFVTLHLYAMGLGFFIGLRASLFFIFLSSLGLLLQLKIDQRLISIFADDPNSLILYFISYLIVLPFCYFLTQQFQIKSKIAKILEKEVAASKMILGDIKELVFITNLDLKILSVNDAVERGLALSKSEIMSKSLFDILYLRSNDNRFINLQHPLIQQFLKEKVPQKLEQIKLYTKNNSIPLDVVVDIKPLVDLQGEVDQVTFIVTNAQTVDKRETDSNRLSVARDLQLKQQATLEDLKDKLITAKMAHLAGQIYLTQNWGEDSQLITQIEQLNMDKAVSSVDLAQFTSNIVGKHQEFAHLINSTLIYRLEFTPRVATGQPLPTILGSSIQITSPYFTALISVKWFGILLNKLLFMACLLSISTLEKMVVVKVDLYSESIITIKIVISGVELKPDEKKMLFIQGYDRLGKTSYLRFGSGLEGVFAQRIAAALNITIDAEYDHITGALALVLYIDKKK